MKEKQVHMKAALTMIQEKESFAKSAKNSGNSKKMWINLLQCTF